MSKFFSAKIRWKNIAFGSGIGALLIILSALAFLYIFTYLPDVVRVVDDWLIPVEKYL